LNAYCHDLAVKGGNALADILGTRVMDPNGELTVNMVCGYLPTVVLENATDILGITGERPAPPSDYAGVDTIPS